MVPSSSVQAASASTTRAALTAAHTATPLSLSYAVATVTAAPAAVTAAALSLCHLPWRHLPLPCPSWRY